MFSRTPARRGFAARLAVTLSLAVAVIALTAASAFAATVSIRVEGQQRTLFSGTKTLGSSMVFDSDGVSHVASGTALWALDAAARYGAFPYALTNYPEWGLFVNSINNELPMDAAPYAYWLYRVNGAYALDGASKHDLRPGDSVLWYYGTDDEAPAAVSVPSSYVAVGTTATAVAQKLNMSGVASSLATATVYAGSKVATSSSTGKAYFRFTQPGDYGVRVEKDGYVRSERRVLKVRYATKASSLTAANTTVSRGTRLLLSGGLSATGKTPAGRLVTITARKAGTSTWQVIGTKTTSSTGKFSFYAKPYASTYYRVSFAGDSSFGAVTSPSRLITVR